MRNLIQGKTGEKTSVSSGYTKDHIERKEGDIWEEDGRQWTIKNGVKQNISKLQKAREIGQMPLFCPECSSLMKHRYDAEFYRIHKHCFDCQVKFETKLKAQGKFEEYQQNINKQSIVYHIKEMENVLLELVMGQSDESFVTEAGDIETWKGKGFNKQKVVEDIQEYIKKLKDVVNS
jgi:hypothetical protein